MVNKMPQKKQVFEKEEAVKLLNYFIAYKKLQNKLDHIKCIAALNPLQDFEEKQMHAKSTPLSDQTDDNTLQSSIICNKMQ
jgi:hypothetical protein